MYEVMYRKPSMIVAPGAGCSIIASEWTRNVDENQVGLQNRSKLGPKSLQVGFHVGKNCVM